MRQKAKFNLDFGRNQKFQGNSRWYLSPAKSRLPSTGVPALFKAFEGSGSADTLVLHNRLSAGLKYQTELKEFLVLVQNFNNCIDSNSFVS